MITRTKINELRALLAKAMVNRQGEFRAFKMSWDDSTDDMALDISFSDQHPNEEFRGCTNSLGEDIPPEVAELIVSALNALPNLLDSAEEQVKRNESIW